MSPPNDIPRAVALLRAGRLVAFPTETVYGLGANALDERAIDLIFTTKGRPATNPLIVHVAGIDIAKRYVAHWPDTAQKLAERLWPGPLTLVLPKIQNSEFRIQNSVTAGRDTLALRVPAHPLALQLLRAFDGPLAAPSANRSTRISPTTAQHVRDEFPSHGQSEPALILDGGPCTVGIESTVLDLTQSPPMILRPGLVTARDLEALIGPVTSFSGSIASVATQSSPGQQPVHYAPTTPTFRFESAERAQIPAADVAVVALSTAGVHPHLIAMPNDPADYARKIYAVLRELDQMMLDAIYIELPPDTPAWHPIRDRLMRAARPIRTNRGRED